MMPRRFIPLAFAVAFLLTGIIAGGFAPSTIEAQEASPGAGLEDIPPVLLEWIESFEVRDPEAFAALYTEDGVFEDVPAGVVAQGRDEIAEAIEQTFVLISDSDTQPIRGFRSGNQAVVEYVVNAVAADTGQTYTFQAVLTAELEGDLIKRTTEYYDLVTILGQLGLLGGPAEGEAGTPST